MQTKKVNVYNINEKKPDVNRWIAFCSPDNGGYWAAGLTMETTDTKELVVFEPMGGNCYLDGNNLIGEWFYLDVEK